MDTEKTIGNCDTEFTFKCPQTWDQLGDTESVDIKFCAECHRKVYFCNKDEDTLFHARQGHCIAHERPQENKLPLILLGEPDVETLKLNEGRKEAGKWDDRENGVDDALKNIQSSTRNCANVTIPHPIGVSRAVFAVLILVELTMPNKNICCQRFGSVPHLSHAAV